MKLDKAIELIKQYQETHDLTPLQIDVIDTLLDNVSDKDTYGRKNINFSIIDKSSPRWNEFKQQRIERGFDESECWNLDATISEFIAPRLQCFKEHTMCYPSTVTEEGWNDILDEMISFFKGYKEKWNVQTDDKGLELFVKYFHDLWW